MSKVTVDYEVWLGVTVDTETGEVLHVEHSDDLCSEAESFFNPDFGEEGNDLPEYLPADHPDAIKAEQLAKTIAIDGTVKWHYLRR